MLLNEAQMFAIACFSLRGTLPTFVLINKQSTEAPNYRLQEYKIPQMRLEPHSTLLPPFTPVLYLTQNEETPLDTVPSTPQSIQNKSE